MEKMQDTFVKVQPLSSKAQPTAKAFVLPNGCMKVFSGLEEEVLNAPNLFSPLMPAADT
jgi:hypothetical protein